MVPASRGLATEAFHCSSEALFITLTPTLSLRERGPVGWYSCLSVHFYLPLLAHQGRGGFCLANDTAPGVRSSRIWPGLPSLSLWIPACVGMTNWLARRNHAAGGREAVSSPAPASPGCPGIPNMGHPTHDLSSPQGAVWVVGSGVCSRRRSLASSPKRSSLSCLALGGRCPGKVRKGQAHLRTTPIVWRSLQVSTVWARLFCTMRWADLGPTPGIPEKGLVRDVVYVHREGVEVFYGDGRLGVEVEGKMVVVSKGEVNLVVREFVHALQPVHLVQSVAPGHGVAGCSSSGV